MGGLSCCPEHSGSASVSLLVGVITVPVKAGVVITPTTGLIEFELSNFAFTLSQAQAKSQRSTKIGLGLFGMHQ